MLLNRAWADAIMDREGPAAPVGLTQTNNDRLYAGVRRRALGID